MKKFFVSLIVISQILSGCSFIDKTIHDTLSTIRTTDIVRAAEQKIFTKTNPTEVPTEGQMNYTATLVKKQNTLFQILSHRFK